MIAKRRYLLGWLVLAVGLTFYLLTLRSGHRAGDFAMYVQHTANMAEGRPYAETGYFQNPAATSVGTKNYPPGLPVLLLPIYLLAGFKVTAMKVLMVLLFFGALYAFWRITREQLTPLFAAVMLLDVVFTPYLWEFKDNIESDFPFLLPLLLSIWLMERASADKRDRLVWVGLGTVMYAAVAIRPIGLALLISLLLFDLADGRRYTPSARFWVAGAALVALMTLQAFVLPLESGSYSSAFLQQVGSPGQLMASMIDNAKYYILACASRLLLTNGHGTLWGDTLLVISIAPFVVGIWTRLRQRIGAVDVFFIVYAGILLVWPFRQPNYFIPLIPLLSFYVFVGLERLSKTYSPKAQMSVAIGAAFVLAATFGMRYSTLDFKQVAEDVMSESSMEFYERVREDTPPDAVVLSRIPREIAFFTGRRSTPPNLPADNRDEYSGAEATILIGYVEEVGVDYLAAGPKGPYFHREVLPLWDLAPELPEVFEPEFENAEWRLYSVRSGEAGVDSLLSEQ